MGCYYGFRLARAGHDVSKWQGRGMSGIMARANWSSSGRTPAVTSRALIAAGVPTDISDNLRGALWAKLITNCAYNALSFENVA